MKSLSSGAPFHPSILLGHTALPSSICHFIPASYGECDQKRISAYKLATPAHFITSMLFVCLNQMGEEWWEIKSRRKAVLTAQFLCCRGLLSSWCNKRSGGLCLLFLASSEVMSIAEDTGAVAKSPAGAGTMRFQVLRSHLLAVLGNIWILADSLMPALQIHQVLPPSSQTPSTATE